MTTNIAINLKKLITLADLSEHELSRRTGVKQSVINRLLSGQNKNPTLSTLTLLANYFMVSVSHLIGDDEVLKTWKGYHTNNHLGWTKIPVYHWKSTPDLISKKTIMTECHVSTKAFALVVPDQSMEPLFPVNCLIIIEPGIAPEQGDFIILATPTKEIIIRNFLLISGVKYVSPINTKFGKIRKLLVNEKILGTVVRTIYDHKIINK